MSPLRPVRRALSALLILGLLAAPAWGQQYLWDGGGSDGNMFSSANWQNNLLPPNNGTATLNFRGTSQLNPYNLTMWFVDGIAFPNDGTTSFTLQGARLNIGDAGINQYRGWTQTIKNPISLVSGVAQHQWISRTGFLVLQGDIDLASVPVKVWGNGEVRVYGDISGTNGSIDVGWSSAAQPAGTLQLSGLVNVDIDTNIGTLVIDTDQPQPPYTTMSFANGTTFRALGTQNITQTLQLSGVVTYDGSGVLRSEASISGSGDLVVDGSTGATLGLGPANNVFPFPGSVTVIQGELELNGAGTIAQLGGDLDVGSGPGGAHSARVVAANAGVIADGNSLIVRSAGLVDIAGPIAFDSLTLLGGDLTVDAAVTADPIVAGNSSRTATLDAPWATPQATTSYDLSLIDGSADPDLRLPKGCQGNGILHAGGSGQVELGGNASNGPGKLDLEHVDLTLDRTTGGSILSQATCLDAALRTAANDQLGSGCAVVLESGASLDIANHVEHLLSLEMSSANVAGTSTLFVANDLTVLDGTCDVAPALSFGAPVANLNVAPNATLSTNLLDGASLRLQNGGLLEPDEINASFTVANGTLRFTGQVDGDFDVEDALVVVRDLGPINVIGDITCSANATLDIELDASGASAGDEFVVLDGNSLSGSFGSVQFPTPPAGHFWTLHYGPSSLTLRLESILQADLDLDDGSNGDRATPAESLDGLAGVDFRVLPLAGVSDVELCSVRVDSLSSPGGDSYVGLRLYETGTQTLVAGREHFFASTASVQIQLFVVGAVLQPGTDYRLVVYGSGGLLHRPYLPDLAFPYLQSSLIQIQGAFADSTSDGGFPSGALASDRFPQVHLGLGGCDLTATGPEAPHWELTLGSSPNPFNPSTTVSLEIPSDGRARVEVFDVRGRRVATLLDEVKPAGHFEVQWFGRDDRGQSLASAVYYLRLSHPAGDRVQPIVLVK